VLAVEIIVVHGKGGPKVLVNEIAPWVHNSGHWTLDGASISQFEQHVRAIGRLAAEQAGPPWPGHHDQPDRGDINSYEQWLTVPGATVHL
jgi:5-(carboxyamino)imidazole ribonucleotide synthase